MTEVEPNPKTTIDSADAEGPDDTQLPLQGPRKGECGCGCGVFGTLRSRPWRTNDVTCVKRGCSCNHCRGKRNKTMGALKQRAAKKELGIVTASSLHTGHEENDNEAWEKKHGTFAGPAFTAWNKGEKQYEANRPLGRGPLLYLHLTHPKWRFSLTVIRGDRLEAAWYRLGVNRGWLIEPGKQAANE